jgi:hypothetical protein
MLRRLLPLVLLGCALLPAACRTQLSEGRREQVQRGAHMHRTLRSYHVVYSEHRGRVGFVKVFDVAEAGGHAYPWSYVYDLDFNELGWVDQFGGAYQYVPYTRFEREIHGAGPRVVQMPADSLENNVMRLLGIDPALDNVSFPRATQADVAGG